MEIIVSFSEKSTRELSVVYRCISNMLTDKGVSISNVDIGKFVKNLSMIFSDNPDVALSDQSFRIDNHEDFVDYFSDKKVICVDLIKKDKSIFFKLIPEINTRWKMVNTLSLMSFKKYGQFDDLDVAEKEFDDFYNSLVRYAVIISSKPEKLEAAKSQIKFCYRFYLENKCTKNLIDNRDIESEKSSSRVLSKRKRPRKIILEDSDEESTGLSDNDACKAKNNKLKKTNESDDRNTSCGAENKLTSDETCVLTQESVNTQTVENDSDMLKNDSDMLKAVRDSMIANNLLLGDIKMLLETLNRKIN